MVNDSLNVRKIILYKKKKFREKRLWNVTKFSFKFLVSYDERVSNLTKIVYRKIM